LYRVCIDLLLCVALEPRDYGNDGWSAAIGQARIYEIPWNTELLYVCQYHSK